MKGNNLEKGLASRYVIKKVLGEYPPWYGFSVTDSLNEKNYLLFTLKLPSSVTLSLEDLKMRDKLFSEGGGIILPLLSLQKNDGGVTFLLPFIEPVPLTKALPSMNPDKCAQLLKLLTSEVLSRMAAGTTFNNLGIDSLFLLNGSLTILPTAYLLPHQILNMLEGANAEFQKIDEPVHNDLCNLGAVFKTFSKYLDTGFAETCAELSTRLASLGIESNGNDFFDIVTSLGKFCGISDCDPLLFTNREPPYSPHAITMRTIKQAAVKARAGEKHLVIVKGKAGEGKTRLLRLISGLLKDEWGFTSGEIMSLQNLFQDNEEEGACVEHEFVLIDNHAQEMFLDCYFIDTLCRCIDRYAFTVIAVNEELPTYIAETLHKECSKKDISIKEISLPACSKGEKKRIISHLIPSSEKQLLDRLKADRSLAFMNFESKVLLLEKRRTRKKRSIGILDVLSEEEASILNFLAVFKFEIPLAFLQYIYSTEETDIYRTLGRLTALGIVATRAECSNLAQGSLCLAYSLSSRSLCETILDAIPTRRRKQIHRNIAHILEEKANIPSIYIFYHLVKGGENAQAALKGYDLFHTLLKGELLGAINCFNESYLSNKLDRFLPKEKQLNLLLELGNYFSMIGDMGKAEKFYSRCREETGKKEIAAEFRTLAVEAVRRECEIREKKGDFLQAEKILTKALDTHGDHLQSNERAKLYLDLAWIHFRMGELSKSWENCMLVIKLLDDKQCPIEIAQACNLMGAVNWNRSRYDEAVEWHNKCLSIRAECKDEIGVATSYNNLGLVYRSMGRIEEALECFRKSMEIKQRHNALPGVAAAHMNIALAYLDQEELKEAEKNCEIAGRLAEDIGNQQLLAEAHGTMGEIQYLQGNFDKARNYYYQDLHLCEKTMSLPERAVTLRRLGELNLSEGKIKEATALLKQAAPLNQKIGSRLESVLLNLLDGRILLAMGKRKKGMRKLEGASVELSLLGRKIIAAIVEAEIGELYMKEGNEPLAREYLLRATSILSDSKNIPHQVDNLREKLDKQSMLTLDTIHTDSARFKALCRISSIIRTIHDQDKLHRTITEMARKITGMKRSVLILQSDGKDTFRVLESSEEIPARSILKDKSIITILLITRQLGYPFDISRTNVPPEKVSKEFLKKYPSILCIPLWIQDEVTGFLYLDSPDSGAGTSDEDHSFLVAFSQLVALGLEKVLLSRRAGQIKKRRAVSKTPASHLKEKTTFQDIIGNSRAMRQINEEIDRIRNMDTTILLTGNNGVGKDLIAKTIHYVGHRRDKPFVSLNCAGFSKELLESELFGHERGSFTGAHRQKTGHFESANEGTIFLNEIGDMPLAVQPQLLRVLEEQKFFRVGGTKEISTNVRIIAATNKNLFQCVKEKTFREDLYYRINVFPIRVPDLKEKQEDIELLTNHFLTKFCRIYNIPIKSISPEAMAYLSGFSWPGNVRELENTIKRLIIISKKETILPEDLPEHIVKHAESFQAKSKATLEESIDTLLENLEFSKADPILPQLKGAVTKKIIEKVGDKSKAADLLGISKPTIYSILKKYDKKH